MIFVILSLITVFFISITNRRPYSSVPSILLLICYAVVFSMRAMQVADTDQYFDTYSGQLDLNMELGYLALNYFFADKGVPFNIFLLFIAAFDLLLWYFCTKKVIHQNNILIALLVFMSNMGVIYYGIVLRSGMASSVMFIPLSVLLISYEKNINPLCNKRLLFKILFFLICLIVAGLFHQTIYVLIVGLFLYFVPLNNKLRYAILILGLIVSATPALSSFLTTHIQPVLYANDLRMADRFNRDIQTGLSVNQVINVIYGFIFIRLLPQLRKDSDKRQYSFVLDLFCTGVLFSGLFSFLIAGSRLGHLLMFYDFLMPAILLKSRNKNEMQDRTYLIFLVIVVLNFVRVFTSTPDLIHYIQ